MTDEATNTVVLEKITGRLVPPPRFYRDDFLIGTIVTDYGQRISIKGTMAVPAWGEMYEFQGGWEEHEKYGRQFGFVSFVVQLPTSIDGIKRFMVDSLSWVGSATADALLAAYGEDALQVLLLDPDRVARDISGLTPDRVYEIQAELQNQTELAQARVQLETIFAGIRPPRRAIDYMLRIWGCNAPAHVRDTPYDLVKIPGIGFPTADQIAVNRCDYVRDGHERRCEAITHVLCEAAAGDGHTFLDGKVLFHRVHELIGYPPTPAALEERTDKVPEGYQLPWLGQAEDTIATRLRQLRAGAALPLMVDTADLAADQVEAVQTILDSP
ncbi:MAG: helix-hairpin-helix domain-containing protein, partial [Pseudomonadota bacterium]